MSGKILDSNIIIDLFRGDIKTIEKLQHISLIYVPVIVLGELFYGANISNQVQKRLDEIEDFTTTVRLLNCDKQSAKYYGQVKAQLKRAGTPIPENDIWIAAIGLQHNLIVLTNDQHFLKITGLRVEMLK